MLTFINTCSGGEQMGPMRRQCYWREHLENTFGFHQILTLLWPLIMQACCIFLQHCKPFSIVSKFNICDWNFYLTTIILLCDYHSHSSIHDYMCLLMLYDHKSLDHIDRNALHTCSGKSVYVHELYMIMTRDCRLRHECDYKAAACTL